MTSGELIEELKSQGIRQQKVLDALAKVDRSHFVPESNEHLAYENRPLSIGDDQTISQPYIVALMLELLDLTDTDRVLEIGTGSGYLTALLATLSKEVYGTEIIKNLYKKSERALSDLSFSNIHLKCGDGVEAWKEQAPFNKIVVSAAAPYLSPLLIEQLSDNGIIVAPIGGHSQRLIKGIKINKEIYITNSLAVRFVPMTGQVQHSLPHSL